MPIQQKCFLTGLPAQVNDASGGVDAYIVNSPACGLYWVSRTLAASSAIWERYADRLHILAAVARQRSDAGEHLELHTGNIEDLLASVDVPDTPIEKIDLILQYIRSNTSHPGKAYHFDRTKDFPIALARNIGEWDFLFAEALKAGFIEGDRHSGNALLTLKGWERIEGRSSQPQASVSTPSGQSVDMQQEAHMINQPQVFLCHASEDKEQVMGVYRRLEAEGFKPWIDQKDLLPGQDWDREIRRAIKNSERALTFFSTRSVPKRGYYQRELKLLLEVWEEMPQGEIFIIPVKLDECDIPDEFKKFHHANLFESDGFDKIVRAIQADTKRIERDASESPDPHTSDLVRDLNLAREQRRKQTIVSIIEEAQDLLRNSGREVKIDQNVLLELVGEDWAAHFFDQCQDVRQNEIKRIWVKILAGEIAKPGSFCYRTLNVVQRISRTEAEYFERLAPYVLVDLFCSGPVAHDGTAIVPVLKPGTVVGGLGHNQFMRIVDVGLVAAGGNLLQSKLQRIPTKWTMFYQWGDKALAVHYPEHLNASPRLYYLLTEPGKELVGVFNIQTHEGIRQHFVNYFKKEAVAIDLVDSWSIIGDSVANRKFLYNPAMRLYP